jgi:hypothetical protein
MTAVLAPPDSHPMSWQSCLTGRAQARDFVDVAALVERFGFEGLCRLAAEKDPGFSPKALADMPSGVRRYTADDFDLDAAGYKGMARAVASWQRTLAGAQTAGAQRLEPRAERCAGSGPRRLRGAHERGNTVDGRGDVFAAGAQADTEVAGHTEAVPRC